MQKIFATIDKGVPWKLKLETEYDNNLIDLERWIALWQKFYCHNIKEAFKNLVYLGYCGSMENSAQLKKVKIGDLLKVSKRKVFNCYIIGSHSCGKSSFLDCFINS